MFLSQFSKANVHVVPCLWPAKSRHLHLNIGFIKKLGNWCEFHTCTCGCSVLIATALWKLVRISCMYLWLINYCRPFIKSFIQGVLPGLALKLFLTFLPAILMVMSKFEGFTSISSLERRSASRYYIFNFVNVFLGSIIAGAAFEQLNTFIKQSANQ